MEKERVESKNSKREKGKEVGEIGANYATLHNILQSKKGKRVEAKKKDVGARIARYRK